MHEDSRNAIHGSIEALFRFFFLIFAVSTVSAIFAYGVAKNIRGSYEVHFSYMISMEQQETAPGFRYDGFYGLSAIDLFSKTVASIANTPETIVAAHKRAGLALPTRDAIRLVRIVRTESAAPQLVRFTVRDASQKNAQALAHGVREVVNDTVDAYNGSGGESISFHGVFTEPWTSYDALNPVPVAAVFFMIVFVTGIMIVLFREAIARGST